VFAGMEEYARTRQEFPDWLAAEDECREYRLRLRWREGFRCPGWGNSRAGPMGRRLFRGTQCDLEGSLTAGTLFPDTRKPLRLWFQAMWYVTNPQPGVNALGLQRLRGWGSYHTAWIWLHKLRRALVRPGGDRLPGTVEVDETFIGGPQPGKRGRGGEGKVLVLVAAPEEGKRIGRIRLRRITDASRRTLEAAVAGMVAPGSSVRTDGGRGDNRWEARGYSHEVIRQETALGDNLLPMANRVASLLKRWLLGTHQGAVRPSHLDYDLDEFTFRFNRRTSASRGKLFYRLVQQPMTPDPVPAKLISSATRKS
jgi:ISXO2-like transposase domain